MLILYKRSHVEYHGRFTARFLKRIQLGSPGLKTGLLLGAHITAVHTKTDEL